MSRKRKKIKTFRTALRPCQSPSLFSACRRLSGDLEGGKKKRTYCLGSESSVEQISSCVMLDWRPRLREHNGLGVLNATSHRFHSPSVA
jgi:hypothetical protein